MANEMKTTLKQRFRNPAVWYALFSIFGLIITQIFGQPIPPNWEGFIKTVMVVLISLGVILDPTKPTLLTWLTIKESFRSPVVRTNIIMLFVFILVEWVGIYAGWDTQILNTILISLTSVLSAFGVIQNPYTPRNF